MITRRLLLPSGDDNCIVWVDDRLRNELLQFCCRGTFQRYVLHELIRSGYIIGYKATGDILHGKARSYSGRYARSIENLMRRVNLYLDKCHIPIYILSGSVGPKGAWGYYFSD